MCWRGWGEGRGGFFVPLLQRLHSAVPACGTNVAFRRATRYFLGSLCSLQARPGWAIARLLVSFLTCRIALPVKPPLPPSAAYDFLVC